MKKMLAGIEQTKTYDEKTGLTTLKTSIDDELESKGIFIAQKSIVCNSDLQIAGQITSQMGNLQFYTPATFNAPVTFNSPLTVNGIKSDTDDEGNDKTYFIENGYIQPGCGYESTVLPELPTTAGTYVLKFTLAANGSKSFVWVAA